ncbi:hypothetical protein CB1_000764022 [Camelus ferus]|nr:hypothetical protein CB1_000764022 [Camelus ferus]
MCASEMGTLWHHWSPVLISLAALFSKGQQRLRAGQLLAPPGRMGLAVCPRSIFLHSFFFIFPITSSLGFNS